MTTKQNEVIKNEAVQIIGELRDQTFTLDDKIGDLACITDTLNGLRELLSDLNQEIKKSQSPHLITYRSKTQALLDLLTYSNADLKKLNAELQELHKPMHQNVFKIALLENENRRKEDLHVS